MLFFFFNEIILFQINTHGQTIADHCTIHSLPYNCGSLHAQFANKTCKQKKKKKKTSASLARFSLYWAPRPEEMRVPGRAAPKHKRRGVTHRSAALIQMIQNYYYIHSAALLPRKVKAIRATRAPPIRPSAPPIQRPARGSKNYRTRKPLRPPATGR